MSMRLDQAAAAHVREAIRRGQQATSPLEEAVARMDNTGKYEREQEAHRDYYDSGEWGGAAWRGFPVQKYPVDLMTYQEVIWETRPNVLIECGTSGGGSALFFADMMALAPADGYRPMVVTIDTEPRVLGLTEVHKSLHQVVGSSTDPEVKALVQRAVAAAGIPEPRMMVVLDSDHSQEHVAAELEMWADVVTPGCYLVVEDTNINGHPVHPTFGPGPHEALEAWLWTPAAEPFVRDRSRDKFMTAHPGGWLLRL